MRRRRRSPALLLLLSWVPACAAGGGGSADRDAPVPAETFDLLDQAPRTVETPTFRAELLALEMRDAQRGELRLRLTNASKDTIVAGVAYEARVGGWFRNRELGTGDARVARLAPGSTDELAMPVYVAGYSPDAFLRLRLGPAEEAPGAPGRGRLSAVAAERTYGLGGAPWARTEMDRFVREETTHLELFARRGGGLTEALPRITRERDAALEAISALLGVEPPARIRIVLYPDPFLKWIDTGHWGSGWAFDSTLVEVVGEPRQMDPYHELVHLVAERVGSPPALFREGLAVHVAERLGGDGLRFLGRDETIEEAVCRDLAADEVLPLERVVTFDAIGEEGTRPAVTYPQSASFVGFLVERHGMERFLEGYARMGAPGGEGGGAGTLAAFEGVFGSTLFAAEETWREALPGSCRRER